MADARCEEKPVRARGTLKKGVMACLGPGLIAGASDDDPSGVATYSQAGAMYGFAMLWVALVTLPLMAAIQEIAARIGRVTGRGLARNMRLNYPGWLVWSVVGIMVVANVINLGADISAMGDVVEMLSGGGWWVRVGSAVVLTGAAVLSQIGMSYARYTAVLRWMSMILLVYVVTGFVVKVPWGSVGWHTVVPTVEMSAGYVGLLVGVLGTTISPYLFFWQAALESEHVQVTKGEEALKKTRGSGEPELKRIRVDTVIGMIFSNAIAYFIILCAAATLHADKNPANHDIESAAQAARALVPLAGRGASWLFSIGIIGGGLLAIPSLAGSAAYAVGELMKWPVGMERKPKRAKGFYGVLVAATLVSVGIVLSPINPIKALVGAAVLNGLAAVPVMVMVMLMFSSRRVMGKFAKGAWGLSVLGWVATAVMGAGAVGFFVTMGK